MLWLARLVRESVKCVVCHWSADADFSHCCQQKSNFVSMVGGLKPEHHRTPFLPSCCETKRPEPKLNVKKTRAPFQKQTAALRDEPSAAGPRVVSRLACLLGCRTLTLLGAINGGGSFPTLEPSYPNLSSTSFLPFPTACRLQMPCSSLCQVGKPTRQRFRDSADRKLNTHICPRRLSPAWIILEQSESVRKRCCSDSGRCVQVLLDSCSGTFGSTLLS